MELKINGLAASLSRCIKPSLLRREVRRLNGALLTEIDVLEWVCEIESPLGGPYMRTLAVVGLTSLIAVVSGPIRAGGLDPKTPTWWSKYQYIQNGGNI